MVHHHNQIGRHFQDMVIGKFNLAENVLGINVWLEFVYRLHSYSVNCGASFKIS